MNQFLFVAVQFPALECANTRTRKTAKYAQPQLWMSGKDRASRSVRGSSQEKYMARSLTRGEVEDIKWYRGALLLNALCVSLGVGWRMFGLPNELVLEMARLVYIYSLSVSLIFVPINKYPMFSRLIRVIVVALIHVVHLVVLYSFQLDAGMLFAVLDSRILTGLAVTFQLVFLTGIFFIDAKRLRRVESLALTFLFPILMIGRFLEILVGKFELAFLVLFSFLYLVFALRKFVDKPEFEVGDKSVMGGDR